MENRLKLDNKIDNKPCEYTPPQNMRTFVQVLLSEEVKGNKSKAESICKVNRQLFDYHYKKHPEFRAWVSEQCDLLLGKYEVIAGYSLIGALLKNDVMAIRTYYELAGKLKHIMKHEGDIPEGRVPRVVNYIAVHVNNIKEAEQKAINANNGSNGYSDLACLPGSITEESKI